MVQGMATGKPRAGRILVFILAACAAVTARPLPAAAQDSKQSLKTLSSKELEAVRPLVGRWDQLRRQSQKLVFLTDCHGYDGYHVHVELLGDRARVRVESQDTWDFDVAGVKLAKDGSITLRMVTGETLKYARSRDDKRVSHWSGRVKGLGLVDGLYVHSDVEGAFPVVEPAPGECDN